MYSSIDYYRNTYNGTAIESDSDILRFLEDASLKIDILTYNRIRKLGIENCSEWEQEIIKKVECIIADFYFKNSSDLETIINTYSINGVSIKYGETNANITNVNGVTIPRFAYELLNMTRFTCLVMR